MEDLVEMIAKKRDESSLTVKWAAVIGILVLVCGGLFGGFASNSQRITRLEERYDFIVETTKKMEQSQLRIETMLNEMYYKQREQKYASQPNSK
jgi:hypothetical protein